MYKKSIEFSICTLSINPSSESVNKEYNPTFICLVEMQPRLVINYQRGGKNMGIKHAGAPESAKAYGKSYACVFLRMLSPVRSARTGEISVMENRLYECGVSKINLVPRTYETEQY